MPQRLRPTRTFFPRPSHRITKLALERLESRLSLSGTPLTVITHGFLLDFGPPDLDSKKFMPWVSDMALAIENRVYKPADQQAVIQEIELARFRADTPDGTGAPRPGASTHFLLPIWDSDKIDDSVPGGPRDDTATTVANRVTEYVISEYYKTGAPVDLHFIGHSRGAIVNSEVLLKLSAEPILKEKIGFVQMTMLDPHPASPYHDPQPVRSEIVDWVDNYYQQIGFDEIGTDPNGIEMVGTDQKIKLDALLAQWTISGRDREHSEVHDWYQWTIDTADTFFPEYGDDVLNAQQFTFHAHPDIRASLYPMDASRDGTHVGYYWSKLGGGWDQRPGSLLLPTALADQFKVADLSPNTNGLPDVAMDGQGNFVVVWQEYTVPGGTDVYARRYDASGTAIGDAFRVNDRTAENQDTAAIAMSESGEFVITWQSWAEAGTGEDRTEVYAKRYDSSGKEKGPEFPVNTTTIGDQQSPDIAMKADGSFIVVWSGFGPIDNIIGEANGVGIFGQRYSADGLRVGGEFLVNTFTAGSSSPAIGVAADGSFVVAWQSHFQAGNFLNIYAQRFDPDGKKVPGKGEFRVNQTAKGSQEEPAIAVAANGEFVISWSAASVENDPISNPGAYARRYSADGIALGDEFPLYDYAKPGASNIAMNSRGDFAITANNSDGSDTGIVARLYSASHGIKSAPINVNTFTTLWQTWPALAMSPKQDLFTVVWVGYGPGLEQGIFARRYKFTDQGQVAFGPEKPWDSDLQFSESPLANQLPIRLRFPNGKVTGTIQPAAKWQFTKLADINTQIPGHEQNFTYLYDAQVAGDTVAFTGWEGLDPGHHRQGLYDASGTSLVPIIDDMTAVPGRAEVFSYVNAYSLDDTGIAVKAVSVPANERVYFVSKSGVSVAAERGPPPNYFPDRGVGLDEGTIALESSIQFGPTTLYAYNNGVLTPVIDSSESLPGMSQPFDGIVSVCVDGKAVVFQANAGGIYRYGNNKLTTIVDTNSFVPGTSERFTSFYSVRASEGNIVFYGVGSTTAGVYLYTGDALQVVADLATTIPGTGKTFFGFDTDSLSIDGSNVVFIGYSTSAPVDLSAAIYGSFGGRLTKIVGAGDVIDGKGVIYPHLSPHAISGSTVVFAAAYDINFDGQAIFRADLDTSASTAAAIATTSALATGSGASATVTLYLPPDTIANSFYAQSGGSQWQEFLFDGTTGAEFAGNIAIVHLVDGQRGDADHTVNGVITFAGGPALDEIPWYNRKSPLDVDTSGVVAPLDALLVINYLNAGFSTTVSPTAGFGAGPGYLDTSANGDVAPLDALLVINWLNANSGQGEGEFEQELIFGAMDPVVVNPVANGFPAAWAGSNVTSIGSMTAVTRYLERDLSSETDLLSLRPQRAIKSTAKDHGENERAAAVDLLFESDLAENNWIDQ